MEDRKRLEAAEALKEAEGYMKTSLFKWKPDFDSAAVYYDKAANNYKMAACLPQAVSCFLKGAEAHLKVGSLFHAAKDYEAAAHLSKDLANISLAVNYWEKAGVLYREHGSTDSAVLALEKASKNLVDVDNDKAIELCEIVADIHISDGKFRNAFEPYKRSIGILLKSKSFEKALVMMEKNIQAYENLDSVDSGLFKLYLSVVLIHLQMGDSVQASKCYESHLRTAGFLSSDESQAAHDLLDAYENGDQETAKNVTDRQVFRFLDNEILKIARNLVVPGALRTTTSTGEHNHPSESLSPSTFVSQSQPQPPSSSPSHEKQSEDAEINDPYGLC